MKRWVFRNPDPGLVRRLSEALEVTPTVATLLANRGFADPAEAEAFLHPELNKLHNPFLLPDMEKAVLRVRQAIDRREKILVYGDRDTDGVTSVAVLMRTLKSLGADAVWTVPMGETYGLQAAVLERFQKEGVRLVVTVDCGTCALEEVDFARRIGLEVIVTDHHLPGEKMPRALAIVNPNLSYSHYPWRDLAGCLTAFKFAQALMLSFGRTFNEEFVVVDLETTGLSPQRDEIAEVGAVLIRNFLPLATFQTLVKPRRPISPEATQVNGITDAMVSEAPSLEEVLPAFAKFAGSRTFVAHNARFDRDFLAAAFERILGCELKNPWVDTLGLSRECFPFPSHSLTSLVRTLKIEAVNTHRALTDCFATALLFQKIEEARDPRLKFFLEDQLDLVTLGTIADVVPLLGENRAIVRHGLPRLLQTRKTGLVQLLEAGGLRPEIGAQAQAPPSARDVAWGITPILNAAGRFAKADRTVQLLLTEDEREARALVAELQVLNEDRKALQKTNLEVFLRLAGEQCDLKEDRILFVVAEGVEHGVTGIIASQLVREFQRPVVLLIRSQGKAQGSSRSIAGFNIVEALNECRGLLSQYGGHPGAAGLTVESGNLELLRERLREIGRDRIDDACLTPALEVDLELGSESVGPQLLAEISALEPFGQGNPAPVFVLRRSRILSVTKVGAQKNHLKLLLQLPSGAVEAMGWGMAGSGRGLSRGQNLDVAFHIEIHRWNGRATLQMILLDFAVSQPGAVVVEPGPALRAESEPSLFS